MTHILDDFRVPQKEKKPSGGTEATAPTLLGVTKPFGGIPWRWKCWATLWRMKMMHTSTSVAQYAILISWGNMLNDRILMDFGDSKFETTPTEPTKKVDWWLKHVEMQFMFFSSDQDDINTLAMTFSEMSKTKSFSSHGSSPKTS